MNVVQQAAAPHFMQGVFHAHQRLENIAGRQATVLESQSTQDFAEIDRLEKDKAEKIREIASTSFATQALQPVVKLAQYVINTLACVIGASELLQKGLDTSALLLTASGVAGLAYRVLSDTGFLKTLSLQSLLSAKTKEQVAHYVEMGTFALTAGLGITGGLLAYSKTSPWMIGMIKTQSWASLFLLGVKLGQGALQLKISFLEKKTAQSTALLQKIQVLISEVFHRMKQNSKDAERIIQASGQVNESVQTAVASLHIRGS